MKLLITLFIGIAFSSAGHGNQNLNANNLVQTCGPFHVARRQPSGNLILERTASAPRSTPYLIGGSPTEFWEGDPNDVTVVTLVLHHPDGSPIVVRGDTSGWTLTYQSAQYICQ